MILGGVSLVCLITILFAIPRTDQWCNFQRESELLDMERAAAAALAGFATSFSSYSNCGENGDPGRTAAVMVWVARAERAEIAEALADDGWQITSGVSRATSPDGRFAAQYVQSHKDSKDGVAVTVVAAND